MKCKCKLFSVSGIPASDGSIIPRETLEEYLRSENYLNAVKNRSMLGGLSHRLRNLENAPEEIRTSNLKHTIGKDDLMCFTPEVGSPTHYIENIYVENDGWCYADIVLLSEEGMDDKAVQHIRRLKGLLSQGVKPGVSAVVLAAWSSTSGSNSDICKKIIAIKSLDITANPSWTSAQITEVYDDQDERIFSNTFPEGDTVRVKLFSNVSDFGVGKSMKVGGQFCHVKAKAFSSSNFIEVVSEVKEDSIQREFSAIGVKDRIREGKMNPRMRFRRLIIAYKQVIKSMGGVEKIDDETLKIMKSLFTTDILDIMKTVTPEVLKGKPINTLIGASSLGKNVRLATQQLQLPYRQALMESERQGFVSKMRYEKIQAAYIGFCNSLIDEVFSSKSTIPDLEEEDEETQNKK